jgi:hypothetical protein
MPASGSACGAAPVTFNSEVFKMSEIKMLVVAFSTMVAVAILALVALYLVQASPLVILSVTTAAALASYVCVCLYCLPRLTVRVYESADDDYARPQMDG